MQEIVIEIDGAPVPKGRPRFVGHVITPEKTRVYEAKGKRAAMAAMTGRTILAGPVFVNVMAIMPIPESWSKKKTSEAVSGEIRPTGKPDADNLVKAALDCLNKIVVNDDAQAVDISIRKIYGLEPKMIITVGEAQ